MRISIIAAMGRGNELGGKNRLLWDFPADMRRFRETTRGHTVVMGRKTFESMGRPLPNRKNIVITRDNEFVSDGVEVVHSLEEAFYVSQADDEVFVIGGASVYREAMGSGAVDRLLITHIGKRYMAADAFFPDINRKEWKACSTEVVNKLKFVEYKRKKPAG